MQFVNRRRFAFSSTISSRQDLRHAWHGRALGISMTIRPFTKRSFARNYPNKLKDAFSAQEGVAAQWPSWRGTACPYRNPSRKESSPRSGTFALKVIARQESKRACEREENLADHSKLNGYSFVSTVSQQDSSALILIPFVNIFILTFMYFKNNVIKESISFKLLLWMSR